MSERIKLSPLETASYDMASTIHQFLDPTLSSVRKMGNSCSMVCVLPSVGARPMITEASAARTCWLVSPASSLTRGMIFSDAASAPKM